jgi:ribosomal protein L24
MNIGDYVRITRGWYVGEYGYVLEIMKNIVHVRLDAQTIVHIAVKDLEIVN